MAGTYPGLERARSLGAQGTITELVRSVLRDRDYENLSVGSRLEAHGPLRGDGKRIACDCVDMEPGLAIARHLLAHHADSVVEGALTVAFASSTPNLVFHITGDDQAGADAVTLALERARSSGAPEGAAVSVDGPQVEIVCAPFMPNLKGYEDVPTLVINAETLLGVARVLREGAEEFRRHGASDSPGTKFFQVSGGVNKPGIFELPLGMTLRSLLDDECGGVSGDESSLQAVMVGGAKGVFYKGDELEVSLDFDSVRRTGGIIGSGAVDVLLDQDCIIDRTRRQLARSCHETCAKCSLGREGSYQLRKIVDDMTGGRSRSGDLELLREIGETMQIGCACAAGKTAANLVLSGMAKFPEEYEAHMKRRRCKALVCAQYVSFHILPELCDGCGACADECPEGAIEGGRNKIHVIDQDSCEKCGTCYEVCSDLRKAVVKAGPVKPKTPRRPIPVGSWKA